MFLGRRLAPKTRIGTWIIIALSLVLWLTYWKTLEFITDIAHQGSFSGLEFQEIKLTASVAPGSTPEYLWKSIEINKQIFTGGVDDMNGHRDANEILSSVNQNAHDIEWVRNEKENEKTNGNILLLGGGPSSVPPLIYLLDCLKTTNPPCSDFKGVNHISFIGDPVDSLILRGRDPQKTLVSLLKVADKYRTYEHLLQETKKYYKFLLMSAKVFEMSLEEAIEQVYYIGTFPPPPPSPMSEMVRSLKQEKRRKRVIAQTLMYSEAFEDFFIVEILELIETSLRQPSNNEEQKQKKNAKSFEINVFDEAGNCQSSALVFRSRKVPVKESGHSFQTKSVYLLDLSACAESCKTFYLKSASDQLFSLAAQNKTIIVFERVSDDHGDFHYLATFFDRWQSVSKLGSLIHQQIGEQEHSQGTEQAAIMIDRAGFMYPAAETNSLLAQLNVDYVQLCLTLLKSLERMSHDTDKVALCEACELNNLETRLIELFENYLRIHKPLDTGLEHERCTNVVIVGAGRAAGEISRRLFHDVTIKNSLQTVKSLYQHRVCFNESNHFQSNADNGTVTQKASEPVSAILEEMASIEATYLAAVEKRRRNVIVVDHRTIDFQTEADALKKLDQLIMTDVYANFIWEITKHSLVPALDAASVTYYSTVSQKLSEMLSREDLPPDSLKHANKLKSYLDVLLEAQVELARTTRDSETSHSYTLIRTTTREPERWSDEISQQIRTIFSGDDYKVIGVGGARHEINFSPIGEQNPLARQVGSTAPRGQIPGSSVNHGESEQNKYALTRIQQSHYRAANLKYLEAVATDTVKPLNFSQLALL